MKNSFSINSCDDFLDLGQSVFLKLTHMPTACTHTNRYTHRHTSHALKEFKCQKLKQTNSPARVAAFLSYRYRSSCNK